MTGQIRWVEYVGQGGSRPRKPKGSPAMPWFWDRVWSRKRLDLVSLLARRKKPETSARLVNGAWSWT